MQSSTALTKGLGECWPSTFSVAQVWMPAAIWWGKMRRTLTRWKAAEPVATATPQVGIWHSVAYYGTAATWLRMAQWLWRWSSTFVIYPLLSHDDDFKNINNKKTLCFENVLYLKIFRMASNELSAKSSWWMKYVLSIGFLQFLQRWALSSFFTRSEFNKSINIARKVSILFSLQQKK